MREKSLNAHLFYTMSCPVSVLEIENKEVEMVGATILGCCSNRDDKVKRASKGGKEVLDRGGEANRHSYYKDMLEDFFTLYITKSDSEFILNIWKEGKS